MLDYPIVLRSFVKALACLWLAGIGQASALDYPVRPITMVVPFPAGGPADTIARILSEGMRASLGQPVIIDNVGGASGTIGVGRVARATPDGYTLSWGYWGTHVANGAIYALTYDVLKDFEPIGLLTNNVEVIVARKANPANDLRGLIAWLKANPGKASWGTQGAGGPSHVGGLLFKSMTGTDFQFVPYRGMAPAMQDLVAGQIDLLLPPLEAVLPHLRAGTIKAYAVTSKTRLAGAPDILTTDEAGLPGFYFSAWSGLWAPKGTSKDVVNKLNKAIVATFADPSVRQRLAGIGLEAFRREEQTPEALAVFQKAEIEKWWPIIRAAGIKGE